MESHLMNAVPFSEEPRTRSRRTQKHRQSNMPVSSRRAFTIHPHQGQEGYHRESGRSLHDGWAKALVMARFSSVQFRGPFRWTTNQTGSSVWFGFGLCNHWFSPCSNQFKPESVTSYYYFKNNIFLRDEFRRSQDHYWAVRQCPMLTFHPPT